MTFEHPQTLLACLPAEVTALHTLHYCTEHQPNKSLTGSRHVSLQLSQVSRARGNVGSGTKGIFNSPVLPCPALHSISTSVHSYLFNERGSYKDFN